MREPQPNRAARRSSFSHISCIYVRVARLEQKAPARKEPKERDEASNARGQCCRGVREQCTRGATYLGILA